MIPVLDAKIKEQILEVADLIKSEVNVKEIEIIDDASGILVKNIKPNFKTLGPKFGKEMKQVVAAINKLESTDIEALETKGEITIDINGKIATLRPDDVEITSEDIEGWLVASNAGLTVALDVTISEDLKKEGVARELVNRIQNLRKDSGFEVTDKINVKIKKDGVVEQAVEDNLAYIKNETLTANLELVETMDNNGVEISFDDVNTQLSIKKQ
jgi:isoleucyl-tRNA synthetase